MQNNFLLTACAWFIKNKAPELEEKINNILASLQNDTPLEDKHKKALGFILFDYSMRHGPATFFDAEDAAHKAGVTDEFAASAKSWIDYSKQKNANQ